MTEFSSAGDQHLVPLVGHVVPRFGRNAFLVGSNYIWGGETNRVAPDLVGDAGGQVFGERYLPLGDTDVSRLIAEIRATRPALHHPRKGVSAEPVESLTVAALVAALERAHGLQTSGIR